MIGRRPSASGNAEGWTGPPAPVVVVAAARVLALARPETLARPRRPKKVICGRLGRRR